MGGQVLDRNENAISTHVKTEAVLDAKETEVVVKVMDFSQTGGLNPSSSIYQ